MAIVTDSELAGLIETDNVVSIEDGPDINFDLQLGPASFDLRLGYSFGVLDTRRADVIDTRQMEKYADMTEERVVEADEGIVVHPGEFILGTTLETIKVPKQFAARIEGRSSYARLGIIPHAAAGYLDPGFEGQITLEIQNLGNVPVRIYPEERVCQLVFETMTSEPAKAYGEKRDAKYMHQKGATGSKLDREQR